MPTSGEWVVFLGAAAIFALLPGPDVLARSLRGGRGDGVGSVADNGIGASVVAAAFGLSAILATSATAFGIVKLAGAGYLVYLGIRALTGRGSEQATETKRTGALRQGILVEALNPKTALFFLAFLPHFVHPSALSARLRDPRWQVRERVASGPTMIGLGGALAIAERG